MDLDQARAFLGEHHRGILATVRGDGRPQMSPVSVALDAEGRPSISTRETAFKVRNIQRDPAVSLCVTADDSWRWIQVDGRAEVVPLPEAMDLLIEQYRAVAGEHPDWDDYRSAMDRDRRVLLRLTITAAGPDASG